MDGTRSLSSTHLSTTATTEEGYAISNRCKAAGKQHVSIHSDEVGGCGRSCRLCILMVRDALYEGPLIRGIKLSARERRRSDSRTFDCAQRGVVDVAALTYVHGKVIHVKCTDHPLLFLA